MRDIIITIKIKIIPNSHTEDYVYEIHFHIFEHVDKRHSTRTTIVEN